MGAQDVKPNTYVCYNEPDQYGRNLFRRLLAHEAVKHQREAARTRGVEYDADDEALADFLAVHWAWLEEA